MLISYRSSKLFVFVFGSKRVRPGVGGCQAFAIPDHDQKLAPSLPVKTLTLRNIDYRTLIVEFLISAYAVLWLSLKEPAVFTDLNRICNDEFNGFLRLAWIKMTLSFYLQSNDWSRPKS